jgi:hypothetical protein
MSRVFYMSNELLVSCYFLISTIQRSLSFRVIGILLTQHMQFESCRVVLLVYRWATRRDSNKVFLLRLQYHDETPHA